MNEEIEITADFLEGSDPTELVPIYRIRKIVGGVATCEENCPHEWQAHDVADVWRKERHTLPMRIEIARVMGGTEKVVAAYGVEDETPAT